MAHESTFDGATSHPQAAGDVCGAGIALLTGGADRPYAFGLATALMSRGVTLELVGNDELDCPEFRNAPGVTYLNLRGDQRPDAGLTAKFLRVMKYYVRLIGYSVTAKPKIFHVLWNNKFEYFDRTLLMLWYRLLGKRIVLTLHNVNKGKRDGRDTKLNYLTLLAQYRLADHMFVHTEKMKQDLVGEFAERSERITVIPFGINNAVPNTRITCSEARQRLGLLDHQKTILFFGNIAPYKGLEYLTAAFRRMNGGQPDYRLIIAGAPKNCESYWNTLRGQIDEDVRSGRILLKDKFIPDEDTELYMKAADVLVLPYRHIYQSGVLFLGYSFGLPVLAADVGSLREEVIEGKTGFIFRPEDPDDLARAIDRYFASSLYAGLDSHRREIRDYALARHSWDVVGQMTINVYAGLSSPARKGRLDRNAASAAADAKTN